jgi:ParB family chromosome partitioning protein
MRTSFDAYVIIAGHRRHAAAQLANLDVVPCVIREDLDTEPKQIEAMLVENTQRTDLTVLEEAKAYQTLLDFPDYNVKKVAKKIGRSEATIRKRLLLNKLPEQAKERIEDRTLNVDQALVIVDFAGNEEATETLLQAAGNPRDWSFAVTSETRKRDAPGKVEAFEKELAEAGATYLPEKDRYMGRWNRLYENDGNALSIEAHVAAGHQVLIDRSWGRLEWFEKSAPAAKAKKPELTEEELEAKRRDAQLTAALDIAHAVRAEHIKDVIKSPPEGAADEALYRLLLDHMHSSINLYAEITGRAPDSEGGHLGIKAALADMTVEQMALLLHLALRSREEDLLKLWAWDAGDYRHQWGPKGWIEDLGSVYHYELSAVEQEVLDHFQQAYDERKAAIAAEDQEDEDNDDE